MLMPFAWMYFSQLHCTARRIDEAYIWAGKFPRTAVPTVETCVQHSLQSAMHEANEKICQLFTYDISDLVNVLDCPISFN